MGLMQDFIVAVRLSSTLARRDAVAAQDALYERTARALIQWAPHLNSRKIFNQLNAQVSTFIPEPATPLGGYVDIGEDLDAT